jgi:hypothetical protein
MDIIVYINGNFRILKWRYLPYIFGLFLRPNFQGISPENMVLYGTNVPPFYDPEIPIDI